MKNKTSCSKCRRRKGRSAHRRARTQSGVVVNRLYNIVDQVDAPDETRTLAAQKLVRWGFSPEKRCLLTTICKSLLVRIPGQDEVFPCVDFRDKLHGLMSFLFRAFDKIFEKLPLSTNLKTLLEQRLLWICHHGCLRNPKTKRAYRVQRNGLCSMRPTWEQWTKYVFYFSFRMFLDTKQASCRKMYATIFWVL